MENHTKRKRKKFVSKKTSVKWCFMGCVCDKRQVTQARNVVYKPLFYRGKDNCFSNFEKTLIRGNWTALKRKWTKIGVLTFIR